MVSGWRAKSFLTAIVACLAILIARPAAGQVACSREDPSEHFLEKFGENIYAYGTSEGGDVLLRIFGNVETGTWTVLISRATPQTLHCVIAAGQAFDVVQPEDQPQPKGTSASYASP